MPVGAQYKNAEGKVGYGYDHDSWGAEAGAFAGKIVPYQFPVLEMGLFLLALFVVELILSVWMVHRQKKQSLIEQMRAL